MSNSDNTKKLYYKIGEVAEIFGVTTSLIRYYEKEFDIIKPRRNKKGNRQFTQNDLDNFHKIFHLIKEEGYTIEGAKAKLSSKKRSRADEHDVEQTLLRMKQFLLELRNNL
ncbi:MAG: MerR family transcriptional regulator [Bacteroidales bacterium]